MSNYEFARATTQGARNYQEDTAAVWPGEGADPLTPAPPAAERHDGSIVAVLADGMGGTPVVRWRAGWCASIFLMRVFRAMGQCPTG